MSSGPSKISAVVPSLAGRERERCAFPSSVEEGRSSVRSAARVGARTLPGPQVEGDGLPGAWSDRPRPPGPRRRRLAPPGQRRSPLPVRRLPLESGEPRRGPRRSGSRAGPAAASLAGPPHRGPSASTEGSGRSACRLRPGLPAGPGAPRGPPPPGGGLLRPAPAGRCRPGLLPLLDAPSRGDGPPLPSRERPERGRGRSGRDRGLCHVSRPRRSIRCSGARAGRHPGSARRAIVERYLRRSPRPGPPAG